MWHGAHSPGSDQAESSGRLDDDACEVEAASSSVTSPSRPATSSSPSPSGSWGKDSGPAAFSVTSSSSSCAADVDSFAWRESWSQRKITANQAGNFYRRDASHHEFGQFDTLVQGALYFRIACVLGQIN